MEKLSKREDAGELTVYPVTVFFHTDEIIEVCARFTAQNSVVLLKSLLSWCKFYRTCRTNYDLCNFHEIHFGQIKLHQTLQYATYNLVALGKTVETYCCNGCRMSKSVLLSATLAANNVMQ